MAFKSLVSAVSEQRQEIKEALSSIAYFETWDPDVIDECCRLSSVAEFAPDKIILGPDNGNSHTVYFILEGVCKMVQHMHVKVKPPSSRKASGLHRKNEIFQYKRYRYSDSKTLHSESKNGGFKSRLLNREDIPTINPDGGEGVVNSQPDNSPGEELKESGQETEEEAEILVEESEGVNEIAAEGGSIRESNDQEGESAENNQPEEQKLEFSGEAAAEVPEEQKLEFSEKAAAEESEEKKLEFSEEAPAEVPEEKKLEFSDKAAAEVPEEKKLAFSEEAAADVPEEQKLEFSEEEAAEVPEVKYEPDHHLKVLEECKKRRNEMISVCKKGVLPEKLKNVRSVFIQIGFLLKGACFGLEKVENFIMSSTKVKCLKITQRFLLKHNPCNIWNRIRLFHALYLPKDARIFENFRSDRLWTEWKKKLSEEIASRRNIHNYTLDSDVPYSLRLVDGR